MSFFSPPPFLRTATVLGFLSAGAAALPTSCLAVCNPPTSTVEETQCAHVVAGEEFGIEEGFDKLANVPASVAADVEKDLGNGEMVCLADSQTTARDALEATNIDLGSSGPALLLKPRMPSEPKAAWGCFCGPYTCPMWVYSFDRTVARRIWSSAGGSVTIIERKDNGSKRLLLVSGSAGHESATLYAWNGHDYAVLREKSVLLGQGGDVDDQAERDMTKFRADAAR